MSSEATKPALATTSRLTVALTAPQANPQTPKTTPQRQICSDIGPEPKPEEPVAILAQATDCLSGKKLTFPPFFPMMRYYTIY